ncbi:MAG TPA: cytochrome C [Flavobacteriales bacterium]|nr:cytochrome C [Flavobacteriales bacterium]HIK68270.1 cytochrome C [Flavobacteriales bacterium]
MIQKFNKRNLLIAFLAVFALIQFKVIDKSPIEINPESDFLMIEQAPKEVVELIQTSCYDCHSNLTTYPWYSNIAPVSWWLKGHIDNGRGKLNFSEWDSYSLEESDTLKVKSANMIEKNWMPILTYKIIHKESRLSDEQRALLIGWLKK